MKTATLIYLAEEAEPWAIGYSHYEIILPYRWKSREAAQQYAEVYCQNHAIPFVE